MLANIYSTCNSNQFSKRKYAMKILFQGRFFSEAEIPSGGWRGGEEIPPGGWRGGEEIILDN